MSCPPTLAAPPVRRRRLVLGLLTGANLLVFASVTIMNVALADARADLSLSAGTTRAVVTSYSLTFGSLLLLGGRVADVVGLRRCLAVGLVCFATASLAGGLATGAPTLLGARALQGAAGALVAATAVPLMSVAFPAGRERQTAFATLGVVMGIGTAGSFLAGGVLVDAFSWRWCLLVNTPVALALALGVVRSAPAGPRPVRARVDARSAVVVCLALSALVLGLDRAAARSWGHIGTVSLTAAGVVGLGVFAWTSRRSSQPLVPPRILREGGRVAAFVAAGLIGVGMFAGMFVLTSYLQEVRGLTPLRTGLAFVPFGIGAVGITAALPALRRRVAARSVLALGLLMAAVAVALFVGLQPGSGYVAIVAPAMVLLGAGGTIVMVTAGDVATAEAGADSGVAGALVNAAQQMGAAIGTALLTAVAAQSTREALAAGAATPAAAVAGEASAGLTCALILLGGAAIIVVATGAERGHSALYPIVRGDGRPEDGAQHIRRTAP